MPINLNFFPTSTFDETQHVSSEQKARHIAKNVLRVLLMGELANWKKLISRRILHAVLIKRDPVLLQAMRLGLQEGFKHICEQLKQASPLDEASKEQAQLYISNCLSLLPFSDPNPHEFISVPQLINDEWTLVDYRVTPIELTPTRGFEAAFVRESDRVFAYGLSPITQMNAEPHLIFMGTTYPAGQGFHTTVYTDLEGFETAGKKLYRSGHHKITEWLDKQHKKTHVCGTSLGGALSLLLAIHQGDKLSRVDALNPPGLYEPWKKSKFDCWEKCLDKPRVVIQKQGNDPVSAFGVWKADWEVLHVVPTEAKKAPNGLMDHALIHTGYADTTFNKIDPLADNKTHKLRNVILYTYLRGIFFYLCMVPYHYIIRPLTKFIMSHLLLVLVTAALLVAITLFCFPVLPLGVSIALIVLASLPILGRFLGKLLDGLAFWCGLKEQPPAACHDFHLSNHSSLNLYAKLADNLEEGLNLEEQIEGAQQKRMFSSTTMEPTTSPVSPLNFAS